MQATRSGDEEERCSQRSPSSDNSYPELENSLNQQPRASYQWQLSDSGNQTTINILLCSLLFLSFIIQIHVGSCTYSDWSKTHVLLEYKSQKKCVKYCFLPHYLYIIKQMKNLSHVFHRDKTLGTFILRTLEKCRKHLHSAHVFFISLVFYHSEISTLGLFIC